MKYLKSWQNRKFFINKNDGTFFKVTNIIEDIKRIRDNTIMW